MATVVGLTAFSTDVNGPPVTYSLTGDTSGGGFTINATTGVVTVADSTKIDFETAAGHAYTVTVQSSDGQGGVSSQTFSIGVSDVAPSAPVDSDAGANTVAEGAAAGSTVGITASATDINGPGLTYQPGRRHFRRRLHHQRHHRRRHRRRSQQDRLREHGPGPHLHHHRAGQRRHAIELADLHHRRDQRRAVGAGRQRRRRQHRRRRRRQRLDRRRHRTSTDGNGPAVTYALIGDTSLGGFTVNAATGVVTVADATKIDYESAPATPTPSRCRRATAR